MFEHKSDASRDQTHGNMCPPTNHKVNHFSTYMRNKQNTSTLFFSLTFSCAYTHLNISLIFHMVNHVDLNAKHVIFKAALKEYN